MERYYAVLFHGIIGVVTAATIIIIPFHSFTEGLHACATNVLCLTIGIAAAFLLDKWNNKFENLNN